MILERVYVYIKFIRVETVICLQTIDIECLNIEGCSQECESKQNSRSPRQLQNTKKTMKKRIGKLNGSCIWGQAPVLRGD